MTLNAWYPVARAALFRLDAEDAHALTMKSLSAIKPNRFDATS